jgi:hypothetical protein
VWFMLLMKHHLFLLLLFGLYTVLPHKRPVSVLCPTLCLPSPLREKPKQNTRNETHQK